MPDAKKQITIDDVLAYGPCSLYTRERLTELFAGRLSLTTDDILALDIPPDHKLDCLLRVGLIPDKAQQALKQFMVDRMQPRKGLDKASKSDADYDAVRNRARAAKQETPAAAVVSYAHLEKLTTEMTREQRHEIIEAEAQIQLTKLLELLNG